MEVGEFLAKMSLALATKSLVNLTNTRLMNPQFSIQISLFFRNQGSKQTKISTLFMHTCA